MTGKKFIEVFKYHIFQEKVAWSQDSTYNNLFYILKLHSRLSKPRIAISKPSRVLTVLIGFRTNENIQSGVVI